MQPRNPQRTKNHVGIDARGLASKVCHMGLTFSMCLVVGKEASRSFQTTRKATSVRLDVNEFVLGFLPGRVCAFGFLTLHKDLCNGVLDLWIHLSCSPWFGAVSGSLWLGICLAILISLT